MSSFIVNNEVDEESGLRRAGFLCESLVAVEDRALFCAMSGKQFNQLADISSCVSRTQPFHGPIECILHARIVADPFFERRGQKTLFWGPTDPSGNLAQS